MKCHLSVQTLPDSFPLNRPSASQRFLCYRTVVHQICPGQSWCMPIVPVQLLIITPLLIWTLPGLENKLYNHPNVVQLLNLNNIFSGWLLSRCGSTIPQSLLGIHHFQVYETRWYFRLHKRFLEARPRNHFYPHIIVYTMSSHATYDSNF